MERIEKIKGEVLKEIRPTINEKKELLSFYNKIESLIYQYDSEHMVVKVDLVGSVAKDTFLRKNRDLDIFMFFSKNVDRKNMEEYALSLGKKIFEYFGEEYIIKYAEHPYVKGVINGFEIELVPAYLISKGEKIISAVDRTPYHKEYVLSHLKRPDEVRLLKKFMKSIGVYGSEHYVNGFSGYACELLIIKYGSFENVLKEFSNIGIRKVICMERCDISLYRKKFNKEALIIVDPVDPNRNVTSALSLQNLARFKLYARMFLSCPKKEYFYIDKIVPFKEHASNLIKNNGKYWFVIEFKNVTNEIKDTIYPQLEKFRKRLLYIYNELDFGVERSFSFIDDETYGLYFEFNFLRPSLFRMVSGPGMFVKLERIKGFIDKYPNFLISENGQLKSNVKRDIVLPEDIFDKFKYLSEDEMHKEGIPKHIVMHYHTLGIYKSLQKVKNKDFYRRFLPDGIILSFLR